MGVTSVLQVDTSANVGVTMAEGTAIPNVFAVPATGADREDWGNAKRKTRLERKQDMRNARRSLLQKVGDFRV